jgi:hypothetical protein
MNLVNINQAETKFGKRKMKATIQEQNDIDNVTTVTLQHTGSGYQLQITPARTGFLIHSSQGVTFRKYDNLSYEIEPERIIDDRGDFY